MVLCGCLNSFIFGLFSFYLFFVFGLSTQEMASWLSNKAENSWDSLTFLDVIDRSQKIANVVEITMRIAKICSSAQKRQYSASDWASGTAWTTFWSFFPNWRYKTERFQRHFKKQKPTLTPNRSAKRDFMESSYVWQPSSLRTRLFV